MKRLLCLALLLGSTVSTQAVIVAGARGGGDNLNNTTRAELETIVDDGFFFDHVFTLGAGNGVYLGYSPDPGGPVGYALTAMHIDLQGATTLTIEGETYDILDSRTAIDSSDLALIRFTHPTNQMPSLPALSLAPAAPANGTPVVMIGRGRNRSQAATTDADVSDAVSVTGGTGYTTTTPRLKRWGTNNTVEYPGPGASPGSPTTTETIGGISTTVFRTFFDEPSTGEWLTTNQAQGVTNDSGGGVFSHDGLLLGIMVAVQRPQGASANDARFGNATLMADIATYKTLIDEETGGMLIPEPATAALLLGALAILYGTRRSRSPA